MLLLHMLSKQCKFYQISRDSVCLLPRDIHSFILTCPRLVTRGRRVIFGWHGLADFVQACLEITCSNWSKVITWFCTTCVLHWIRANWLTSAVRRGLL